jgi:hypothetical protein
VRADGSGRTWPVGPGGRPQGHWSNDPTAVYAGGRLSVTPASSFIAGAPLWRLADAVGGSEAGDGVQPAAWVGSQLGGAAAGLQELTGDGQTEPGAVGVGGWGAPEPVEGPLALG